MGMILGGHVNKYQAEAEDTITLSGQTVNAFSFGSNATAEVKVDNDGLMYQRQNFGIWTQIDSAADWIRPTSSAGSPYRSRYTNLTGDALSAGTTLSEDSWYSTANDFIFQQQDTTPTVGFNTSTFDIEIDDGTTQQAITSYTLTANREDF